MRAGGKLKIADKGQSSCSSWILPIRLSVLLLLSCISYCKSEFDKLLQNQKPYFLPKMKGSISTLTADYRDSFTFPLWSLYENPQVSAKGEDWVKTYSEERDIQIDLVHDNPTYDDADDDFDVRLLQKKLFLADTNEFKVTPILVVSNFRIRNSTAMSNFEDYCIYVWINKTSDDHNRPELDSDWCLSLRLKIVNSSATSERIGSSLSNEPIILEANPEVKGLRFPYQLQHMFPRWMNYSMTCSSKSDSTLTPPTFANKSGGHFTYYMSDNDIQKDSRIQVMNGYLLEYSPSLSYIKVRSLYLLNFKVLRGAKVTQPCRNVTFGQLEENGFVFLCEGEDKLELHSFEVFEGKYHIRSKELVEPVIVWDTTQVLGTYDRCDISKKDRGFLSCRKAVNNSGILDYSQEIILFEIVLEPIQARMLSTLTIPQFRILYQDYRDAMDLSPLLMNFEGVKILHREFTQVVIAELFVINGTTAAYTWYVSIDLFEDNMQTSFVVSSRDIVENLTMPTFRTKLCNFEKSALLYSDLNKVIYSFDDTNHNYYYDTHDLGASTLISYSCFKTARVMGLLLDLNQGKKKGNEYRVVLYGMNQTNNAFRRKIADVTIKEYIQGPMASYYNEETEVFSFVFFTINKGGNTGIDQLNISLKDSTGQIQTHSSGVFDCTLRFHSLTPLGANFSRKVELHVRNISNGQVGRTSVATEIIRKHDLEYTSINIEDRIQFEGPFYEAQFLTNSSLLKNSSKVVLKPRIDLEFTFKRLDGSSSFEELVWAHDDLLLGFREDHIELLQKQPDRFGYEIVNSSAVFLPVEETINLRAEMRYDQGYRLSASVFRRETYQNKDFGVLALYFSDHNDLNQTNPADKAAFILTLLKIPSTGLVENGYNKSVLSTFVVASYCREKQGSLQVLLIPDELEPDPTGETAKYLWIHGFISYDGQFAVLRSVTLSMNKSTGAWWARTVAGYSFIEHKTLSSSEGGFSIKQIQLLFFNPVSSLAKYRHIFVAVLTEDFFHILTYTVSSQRDWLHTPKSSFKFNTDTLPGNILAFNCSLEWARCVFSLDGGDLVAVAINYSTEKERWYISSEAGEFARYVFPSNYPATRLIFSKRHLLAFEPIAEFFMFVYKRSTGLQHPFVGIKKQFREEHTIRLLPVPSDPTQEVLLKSEGLSSGGAYSFPPLTLKVFNLTEADQREFSKSRLLINDVRLQADLKSQKIALPISIKVTEIKLPGEGLSLKIVVLITLGVLALIVIARVLIFVWYSIRKQEDESILSTDYVDPFEFDYTF